VITRRIVFKILRCKDLINWFEEEFGAQIVYLVRHPIPTSLSCERYDLLPLYLKNDRYCKRYLSYEQLHFSFRIAEHGSELEKKTHDWCLQNLVSIRFLDRGQWVCVHYEDLITNSQETLEKFACFLKLQEKDRLL